MVRNKKELIFNDRVIKPNNTKNWGDLIPYHIIKELSNTKKLNFRDVFNVKIPHKNYKIYSTGSVMEFTNKKSIVWGSGCIKEGFIGDPPRKIYSVRGPKTREELILKGIECPEIYGDPALLYPMIYNPDITKKYKWGFIPHYIEFQSLKDREVIKHLEKQGVKIIDICSGENGFIDELLEVEMVISTSLHGLIAADAYGIPNVRGKLSNKLIGGDFKFDDYYLSVGRDFDNGIQLTLNTSLSDFEVLKFNSEVYFSGDEYLKNSAPWVNNEFDLF